MTTGVITILGLIVLVLISSKLIDMSSLFLKKRSFDLFFIAHLVASWHEASILFYPKLLPIQHTYLV